MHAQVLIRPGAQGEEAPLRRGASGVNAECQARHDLLAKSYWL